MITFMMAALEMDNLMVTVLLFNMHKIKNNFFDTMEIFKMVNLMEWVDINVKNMFILVSSKQERNMELAL